MSSIARFSVRLLVACWVLVPLLSPHEEVMAVKSIKRLGGRPPVDEEGFALNDSVSSARGGRNGVLKSVQSHETGNPWASGSLKQFMDRFNIPSNHGSGVQVDLGGRVGQWRVPSGKCPVYGKYIQLYQPSGRGYNNNFLDDFPEGSDAHPLTGGFNLGVVGSNGTKFSPIDDATLQRIMGSSGPKTSIGRCAYYAYQMKAMNSGSVVSNYKYPFVYDDESKRCFVLAVSLQKLTGSRYCSIEEDSGYTWYCFVPMKNPEVNSRLVYGSGFIGENPDEWQTKCPTKAVSNALFGIYDRASCQPITTAAPLETKAFPVRSKYDCWKTVFLESSSDEAVSGDENCVSCIWPPSDPLRQSSGGVGWNFANYLHDRGECIVFKEVPTCFISVEGSVAYTSLGSIEEESLPNEFLVGGGANDGSGSVDDERGEEDNGEVQNGEEDNGGKGNGEEYDGKEDDGGERNDGIGGGGSVGNDTSDKDDAVPNKGEDTNGHENTDGGSDGGSADGTEENANRTALIAGGVLGLILLLLGSGVGFWIYHRRKSATAVDGLKVPITEAPADGTSGARRATDANVLPEESFWDGSNLQGKQDVVEANYTDEA